MTIVEFLLARIAEDEAVAQSAANYDRLHWTYGPREPGAWSEPEVEPGITRDREGLSAAVEAEQGHHIARHDPARILADCGARRRIVDAYEQADRMRTADIEGLTHLDRARLGGEFVGLHAAVVWLTEPYADHPDFDASWRN